MGIPEEGGQKTTSLPKYFRRFTQGSDDGWNSQLTPWLGHIHCLGNSRVRVPWSCYNLSHKVGMCKDSLISVFENHVQLSPQQIALVLEDGQSFSYQCLDHIATAIARELVCAMNHVQSVAAYQKLSSEATTPLIAVMMTRGVGVIASFLAILKVGAAFVPVDPSFPPDRQVHILSHSQCLVLLSDGVSLEQALNADVQLPPTLVVDSSAIMPDGLDDDAIISRTVHLPTSLFHRGTKDKDTLISTALQLVSDREDGGLLYVLYTSGSTGKPKGVMVKQASVLNVVNWFADVLPVGTHSRVLGLTTFCFDISMLEMFLPLLRGGALVLANLTSQKNPFRLLDVIKLHKVTVVQATPTTFDMFLATGWTGDPNIDFLIGGEAFRPSLLPLARSCRSVRNVYGPTETTIWSSSFTLPRDISTALSSSSPALVVPIGAPINATVFYLVSLDHSGANGVTAAASMRRLVEPRLGEEGELWIGGAGVAKGYLHAPELTAEKFIPDPFRGHGYVYRTGDICRRVISNDGAMGGSDLFVFVRRMDDQVKIDGFRIELAEIEAVFLSNPLVEQAVALVRHGMLVLYVKSARGCGRLGRSSLRDMLQLAARFLPHYMMPKHVVQVVKFPETANGKLDRNALPDPSDDDTAVAVDNHGGMVSVDDMGDADATDVDDCARQEHDYRTAAHGLSCADNDQLQQQQQQRGTRALIQHICTIIEKVRGRRPFRTDAASFASIGVDSLGAVLFVKYLSESVGGVKIDPVTIYAPGVTVRSFAEDLYKRLDEKHPDVLRVLGIPPEPSISSFSSRDLRGSGGGDMMHNTSQRRSGAASSSGSRDRSSMCSPSSMNQPAHEWSDSVEERREAGIGIGECETDAFAGSSNSIEGVDDIVDDNYEGTNDVRELETSFDNILAANRSLVEGMRGVFALFVLVDHFHNPDHRIADAFMTDTYLFILFSGFTTALQLREPPRFTSCHKRDMRIVGQQVGHGIAEGGPWLLPRLGMNHRQFLVSRVVGLMPVLWLGLVLFTPAWVEQSWYHEVARSVEVGCPVLYALAMQSWWRPACHYYGPNSMIYASISLNCFIMYVVMRRCFAAAQDCLMSGASPPPRCPITLQPKHHQQQQQQSSPSIASMPAAAATRSWRQWAGDMTVVLAYNRAPISALPVVLVSWSAFVLGCFTLMYYHTYAKNALFFIAYFAAGAAWASLLETVHTACWCLRWQHLKRDSMNDVDTLDNADEGAMGHHPAHVVVSADGDDWGLWMSSLLLAGRTPREDFESGGAEGGGEGMSLWPWVHDSYWLGLLFPSSLSVASGGCHTQQFAPSYRSSFGVSTGDNSSHIAPHYSGPSPSPRAVSGASYMGIPHDNDVDNHDSGVEMKLLAARRTFPKPSRQQRQRRIGMTTWCCCHRLWRFLPDVLSLVIGVLMSNVGVLATEPMPSILLYIVVPFCFLLLTGVSMLQHGTARCNITRLVLESRPLTAIGYASYPLYLLQRLVLTGYLPCVYFGIRNGGNFDWRVGNPDSWFEHLPAMYKSVAIFCLICVCWCIQKYFQEQFVTHIYARLTAGSASASKK